MRLVLLTVGLFFVSCASNSPPTGCHAISNSIDCQVKVGDQICYWDGSACQQASNCSEVKNETICDSIVATYGPCSYLSGQCTKVSQTTSCQVIQDPVTCNHTNFKPDNSRIIDFCGWNPAKTPPCNRLTQCSDILEQDQCDNHQFAFAGGPASCAWTGSACVEVTGCTSASTQLVCDNISAYYFHNTCRWYLDSSSACGIAAPTKCSENVTQAECNQSPLACIWNTSCSAATQCQYLNKTLCPGYRFGDDSCYLQGDSCNLVTDCSQIPNQVACTADSAKNIDGSYTACAWDPVAAKCGVKIPKACSEILDQQSCNQSSFVCTWNSSTSKCASISACSQESSQELCPQILSQTCKWYPNYPAGKQCASKVINSCSDIPDQTDCDNPTFYATFPCTWDGSTCSQIGNTCSSIKEQSQCNANKNQEPGKICQWANNTCSGITTCPQAVLESKCTQYGTDYCVWSGSGCATISSCSQATQALCPQVLSGTCKWYPGVSKCATIPSQCSDIHDKSDCDNRVFYTGPCAWNGSCATVYSCQGIGSNLTECKNNDISPGCGWYLSWSASSSSTAAPNGWLAGGPTCGVALPADCGDYVDPSKCVLDTATGGPCEWDNSTCSKDSRKCQEPKCPNPSSPNICNNRPGCQFTGGNNGCVPKTTNCLDFSRSNCSSNNCVWGDN